MGTIPSQSADLVVTSPPYPMIGMWDEMFVKQNPAISDALSNQQGLSAFELMHKELDSVWNEVYRILKTGGIACINIGDATRTIDGNFMLYPNHSRILTHMLKIGFTALPAILWRKQTNAPNKFMGSGMLPSGAYVTLEHEYILIVRKDRKREFKKADEKQIRRESALFWEERNVWYSDVWMDLKGTTQKLKTDSVRLRSGAFPFEIPYRLINMFSVKGDTVVDPFFGIGTTMLAAMAACRNSIGFEIEPDFRDSILSRLNSVVGFSNEHIRKRIRSHIDFVKDRFEMKGGFKYKNKHYEFPVITRQETELLLNELETVKKIGDNRFDVIYSNRPGEGFCQNWEKFIKKQGSNKSVSKKNPSKRKAIKAVQLGLLGMDEK